MNIGGEGGGRSQDFDLNLAPIIDCFTVLITFMLASASFLAIGILDTGASAPSPATDPTAKIPSINVEVELQEQKGIGLKVSGRSKMEKTLPPRDGDYDRESLAREVASLRQQFPDTEQLTLSATDNVEYLQVIKTMESLKKHIPTTLLGGF